MTQIQASLAKTREEARHNAATEALKSVELSEVQRANKAREAENKQRRDDENVKYWVDVFGFGPDARSDFAQVFTRGIAGGGQRRYASPSATQWSSNN